MKAMKTVDRLALPGAHERAMLRQGVRAFLGAPWPTTGAVERGEDASVVARIFQGGPGNRIDYFASGCVGPQGA